MHRYQSEGEAKQDRHDIIVAVCGTLVIIALFYFMGWNATIVNAVIAYVFVIGPLGERQKRERLYAQRAVESSARRDR